MDSESKLRLLYIERMLQDTDENNPLTNSEIISILEEKFGTHIFRDYALESYEELEILKKGIDDFFVERIFLEDEEYYEAIIAYKNKNNVKSFLEKHHNHYNKGFYYTYTEKLKGDSND